MIIWIILGVLFSIVTAIAFVIVLSLFKSLLFNGKKKDDDDDDDTGGSTDYVVMTSLM